VSPAGLGNFAVSCVDFAVLGVILVVMVLGWVGISGPGSSSDVLEHFIRGQRCSFSLGVS
jgi:hypothetical protein